MLPNIITGGFSMFWKSVGIFPPSLNIRPWLYHVNITNVIIHL